MLINIRRRPDKFDQITCCHLKRQTRVHYCATNVLAYLVWPRENYHTKKYSYHTMVHVYHWYTYHGGMVPFGNAILQYGAMVLEYVHMYVLSSWNLNCTIW
jgi:hypothetical protein